MHIYIRNALFSPPPNILCISNVCCITNTCVLVYQSEINRPNPGIQIRGSQPPVMRPAALAQGRYKKKLQNKREKKKDFVFPARRTCMLNGSNEGIPTTYPDCVFFCFCFQGGHIKKKKPSHYYYKCCCWNRKLTYATFVFSLNLWHRWTCGSKDDDRRERMNERTQPKTEIENALSGKRKIAALCARSFSCNARGKTLEACRESNRSSGSLRIKDIHASFFFLSLSLYPAIPYLKK